MESSSVKKGVSFNTIFNILILVGMTIAVAITNYNKITAADSGKLMLVIASIGALMGVMNNVLSANGSILTFIFGVLDVTIYSIALFQSGYIGNAALHVLYFLPMQFVGFFNWKKRGAHGSEKVKARRLDLKGWAIAGGAFLIGSLIAYVILGFIDNKDAATGFIKTGVMLDALVMGLNILGQVLMSYAFADQWYAWILVNILSICMWVHKIDSSYSTIYIVKYSFYFLNSLNGLRIWLNLSRKDK